MEMSILEALFISVKVSILSTVISFLVSLPISMFLAVKTLKINNFIISIVNALTAIPPVCAGLICYLIISRTGPLGWLGILYTPYAMIIAQFIIVTPILISLFVRHLQEEYPLFKEECF